VRKKILTICLAGLVVAGGTLSYLYLDKKSGPATAKEWSDQRFSAQFPKDPEQSNEELDIDNKKIDFNQFSCENDGAVYAVSYIDFPGHWKWIGTKNLLTKAFGKFVESEKGIEEVLSQEITQIDGDTALVYRLKKDGKEVSGRFIISGNTLYRAFVTYPIAAAEKAGSEIFLDSFRIKA
jgi:hypothetical protein